MKQSVICFFLFAIGGGWARAEDASCEFKESVEVFYARETRRVGIRHRIHATIKEKSSPEESEKTLLKYCSSIGTDGHDVLAAYKGAVLSKPQKLDAVLASRSLKKVGPSNKSPSGEC